MLVLLWLIIIILVVMAWKKKTETETNPMIVCTDPPLDVIPSSARSSSIPMVDDDMNGSTIRMRVGDTISMLLSGNATTGYGWRIVKMEGVSVRTDARWHYELKQPFLIGSGGYFKRRFEAIQPGQTDVYFIYDPVSDPRMGYDYYLRFDVRS